MENGKLTINVETSTEVSSLIPNCQKGSQHKAERSALCWEEDEQRSRWNFCDSKMELSEVCEDEMPNCK